MQQNSFRLDKLVGFDLHEKTIGIVGIGKIGSAFTQIMNIPGCKILGYATEKNPELISQTKIIYTSLENSGKFSDVISIICPLNANTKNMFNKHVFLLMKTGVVFINTARGGILNTKDLIDAIDSGIVFAAGLDVYEIEKPIFFLNHSDNRIIDELFEKLRSYPNVLITGHQAFLNNEALLDKANTTLAN